MSPLLVVGLVCVVLAVGLFAFVMLGDLSPRIARERRTARDERRREGIAVTAFHGLSEAVDSAMSTSRWKPFRATELELADIKRPPSQLVAAIIVAATAAFAAGALLRQNVLLGLVSAAVVPIVAKMWIRVRTARRQRAFNSQLDSTLQMLASSLRAGQSFPQALDSCSRDADAPMSEELARIVNENRIGRDIVDAMQDTADRMECEDFVWLAEAVETTRESGGNLNEIIDRVAQTIRERAEIREKIHAYAAEGRVSAYVLMGLPVMVGVAYSFVAPGYLNPLFNTGIGLLLMGGSAVMFTIAFFWMRAIVDIKV